VTSDADTARALLDKAQINNLSERYLTAAQVHATLAVEAAAQVHATLAVEAAVRELIARMGGAVSR